ncbi:hypothetical protein HZ996_11625 [Cryomorphaceae bacterium]|nr:hypothetical protein HZ996_11625 [Cryomorphaceae bacterium]
MENAAEAQIPIRPPYGIQLNRFGMMLDLRSEGYLAAPHFQAFYNMIMDRYMRPVARLLLGTYGYDQQTFGFSIQYNPDKDKDLNPHTDASAATLNININLPNESFTGSEVDFQNHSAGRTVRTVFKPGLAIIHRGNVPHATHPITSGQRSNPVTWLYGERMQIPRGHSSSYGGVGVASPGVAIPQEVSAQERWQVPTAPKDEFAPF